MVISSIDLMDKKAVQLVQGKEKVLERDNPLELAREFNKFGETAVIDLDAAMGQGNNHSVIRELCKITECRVGGGIRDVETAKATIALGASRIIIGTKAFENDEINFDFLKSLNEAVEKSRIILAIDVMGDEIVTRGWKHRTGINVFEAVKELEPYASEFLFTCVEKEGKMQGADIEAITRLKQSTKRRITAAGGIHTLEQIQYLASIDVDVQLGMALYTGKINLEEAFEVCVDWNKGNGLVPVIAQDKGGQVLMLAYASRESIRKTFETGNMTYFSRSRNKLWLKGESSGHTQKVLRLRMDCDKDTILAVVEQTGVACHFECYSCFGDRQFTIDELNEILKKNPKLQKEPAEEGPISQAAARLQDYLISLQQHNITLEEVLLELRTQRYK